VNDDDLLARLRAADPAAAQQPADRDRVARLLEETMDDSTDPSPPQHARRSPLPWAAVVAVMAVFAALAFWLLPGDEPTPTADEPSSGPSSSESAPEETTTLISAGTLGTETERCVAPSAELLATALTAFDGEVRSIEDGLVTLTVNQWFAGQPTDVVTVQAPSGQLQALIGAVAFEEGGRFLVAARQDGLMVCGFSAPYSEEMAGMYAGAFGDGTRGD